ncbi:MAG: GNAT family N-acetyltransferase [Verrucomicrobiales bacterium]|jgi:GNAT superfamily N-acetyltransferase|nr:GNAT family N-acetyltransferase [Verrucomicrobiales bacterium]
MSSISCYQPLGAVEIRPVTGLADLQRIADLAQVTWRSAFRDVISTAQIDYMLRLRYSNEALAASLASGIPAYLLLLVDGDPCAFAAHRPAPQTNELQLQQLYVHPEWQRRGLGSRLIDFVTDLARKRGCTHLILTVNRLNRDAQEVYQRRGFTIRESVVMDIGNGFVMNDFVMAKKLSD